MQRILCILVLQAIACAGTAPAARTPSQTGSDATIKGEYYNPDYGYSVVIPKTLAAHPLSGPASNHGFGIDLHLTPPASLWVDGNRNDQGWETLDQAIEARIAQIKEKNGIHIVVLDKEKTHLAGLQAVRFTLRYDTPESRDPIAQEVVLSFRKEEAGPDLIYTIALTGPEYLVSRNRKFLDQIKKTWKLRRFGD
jgi:hypothetical protein